jgi:biofilm PGA synthesis N-glycosyltransferase PgaC
MGETTRMIAEGLFWASLALCVYAYAGYPLLVGLLSALLGRPHRAGTGRPTVSLLIPAYNEAAVIGAKLANALALTYPADKLQVRVVSDGSDDGTDEIVRGVAGVELQRVSPRGGKPNALNQAVPFARGDILVLSDANTMMAPDAVLRLASHFDDPRVGAVTGDVRLLTDAVSHGAGEGLFWKLERYVQRCESRLGSVIGVDGGMYALRRALYVANRPDTLIDDFVIAMNVARAGYRVLYDPDAVASEDAVADPRQEFRRRARTTAGGFQSLFEGRGRPRYSQPGLWAGYLSHKVLRWLGPFLLLALFASTVVLVLARSGADDRTSAFYAVCLALQAACYALALIGHLARDRSLPASVRLPYYFTLTNAAALAGFARWMRKTQAVTWAKTDRHMAGS